MTARANERREGIAARVGFVAALIAALALAAVARDAQSRRSPSVSGPVLPGWSKLSDRVASLEVTTAAETLTVACAGGRCRLAERDGYPVVANSFAAANQALASLRYVERKTQDPDKLGRLGLGDPADGGGGVVVRARDADGLEIAAIMIGDVRPSGGLYVRAPDDPQAFAADGDRPLVADAGIWLDLEFLPFSRGDIAAVDVTPARGPSYRLERNAAGGGDFALDADPAWSLLTVGAANPTGAALEQFKFADVALAADLAGEATSRHAATSFDGLSVILDIHERAGESWAVITAEATAPEAELAAELLSARVAGWAYKLPGFASQRLARPLADIARTSTD